MGFLGEFSRFAIQCASLLGAVRSSLFTIGLDSFSTLASEGGQETHLAHSWLLGIQDTHSLVLHSVLLPWTGRNISVCPLTRVRGAFAT